ncbi:uncharacterized protein LOC115770689 isoform X1 [Drosophila novamexicana]|uniref:uncharacterized protein LOC115770689 isoform X1 n=1 Tax=Drosophila novamexicana TaxID=47314 RepID=UPI0011E5905F|nr:uncharacterized protein LOC115770689 isoform X1 [Drosophila novamexicana]
MSSNSQITTNDVQVKLPEWLKAELFEQLLKDTFQGFKAIKSFKAMPGTKPGDNYATVMLRIELEVELRDDTTKSISYMLKIPHVSDSYQETLGKNKFSIFDMERDMFMIYVQEFKQLYSNVGLEVEFGAKCYKLDIPYEHVLLEDLKPKGFQSVHRQAGVDEEHTLCLLTKLAQWHAASAVRVDTIGPYPVHMSESVFNEDGKDFISKLTDNMIPYVLKSLKTIEGHEAYYDDIKNMAGHITAKILQVGAVDPNEFNVLNHSDCWLSNIMFLYDRATGKLLDSYLVDYQMCKYGSVAFDLLYFLLSSPKLELKLNKFDYFIKQYYDQLIKHLKLLNYSKKLPSLIDIHTSLIKNGIWGYWTVCGVMAGSLLEDTQTASFDNLFSNTPEAEEFRTLLYSGKIYKEHLKLVLPWLQNRGAFQTELR